MMKLETRKKAVGIVKLVRGNETEGGHPKGMRRCIGKDVRSKRDAFFFLNRYNNILLRLSFFWPSPVELPGNAVGLIAKYRDNPPYTTHETSNNIFVDDGRQRVCSWADHNKH